MKLKIIIAIIGLLILSSVVVYFISTGLIRFNESAPNSNVVQNADQNTDTSAVSAQKCTGEEHKQFDLIYGSMHPHMSKGTVSPGKDLVVTLSCDHKKIVVSGAVEQTITAVNEEMSVKLDSDYNFDGYNDLAILVSDGQGYEAIDSYDIYLYEPKTNQFVLNDTLSKLENISVDKEKRQVYQYFNFFKNNTKGEKVLMENIIRYTWANNSLVKVDEETKQVDSVSN